MIFQRIWNSFISRCLTDSYKKQIFRHNVERERKKENTRGEIVLHPVEILGKILFHQRFTNRQRFGKRWRSIFPATLLFFNALPSNLPPPRYEHSEFRITTRMARKKMATASNHHLSLSLPLSIYLSLARSWR